MSNSVIAEGKTTTEAVENGLKILKVSKDKVDIKPNDIYLEPSAGNGSFIPYLKDNKYVAYDIEPESEEIIKQDFLLFEPEYKDYIVIGNPPFGKRSRLAIDFLNHATSMAKVIGFIIPKSVFKSVDFPQPLEPTIQSTSSLSKAKEILSIAFISPSIVS